MLLTLLLAAEWVHSVDPIAPPAAGWGAFVADIDQDGVRELGSVSHGTLPVWVGATSELTPEPWPFETEREDRHAAVPCDVDGDGALELVVAMGGGKGKGGSSAQILHREGDGWRVEELPITKGLRMRGVSCLDLEGDGSAELYLPGHGKKTADMFLARVDGQWVDRAPELGLDRMGNTFGGLWEDLDGDGDLDLVRLENNDVSLMFQDQGRFEPTPLEHKAVRDIALGDVDGDGDVDLYLARAGYFGDVAGDHGARVHLDEGDTDSVAWQFPETCEQPFLRAQGDFEGSPARLVVSDGRSQQQFTLNWADRYATVPDGEGLLVWVDPTARVVNLLAMGLEGRVAINLECKTGSGEPTLLMADKLEQPRPAERQDLLLLNDGAGAFTPGVLPLADAVSTAHAELVDVDLDGDLDLFLVTESTPGGFDNGPDLLWLNDGAGNFSAAPLFPVLEDNPPVEGQFGVAVDLDGDRYPELLSFNGAYPRVQAGHTQLFTNPGGSNGWVEVHALEQDGATSLSARVTVKTDDFTTSRLSNPYPDFRSNGGQAQLFGVGQDQRVKVVVVWPDGTRRVARRVTPGTVVELRK